MRASMADAERGPSAIICGGGIFPGAVAEAIVRGGRQPVMFGIKGWAEAKVIERYPHHWIALGQLGRFFRLAQAERCGEVLFIGTLLRPPLRQVRLDWQPIRLLPRIAGFFRGGDNRLLSGAASIAESNGLRGIGAREVAAEIFLSEGVVGRGQPTRRDFSYIPPALKLIAALGPFDVGQAAIVANNHVLAVEAAEGTDNMLTRIA